MSVSKPQAQVLLFQVSDLGQTKTIAKWISKHGYYLYLGEKNMYHSIKIQREQTLFIGKEQFWIKL